MRIHGIHLRGLSAPAGDHPLGLDPGYTAVRFPDAPSARRFIELIQALLYPSTEGIGQRDSRGRAVLSLALRSDAYVVAADFARQRISLGRQDARDGGYQSLSSDPREIEEYALAVGLPPPADFRRLHVCGLGAASGDELLPMRKVEKVEKVEKKRVTPPPRKPDRGAERAAERARLLAEHEERVLALAQERAKREAALEQALAAARAGRVRSEERLQELRTSDGEYTALERQHKATLAELEKYAALAEVVEDFDARLTHFRALAASRETERKAIDETRAEVLAERARLRGAPRKQLIPVLLGLALGITGGAAGAVGFPIGYAAAAAGVLALLAALGMARAARSQLARSEALLAALRVRERGSERRFETEGAQIRGLMISLELDSVEALSAAVTRYSESLERAEIEKAKLAELAAKHPTAARDELARLERERGQADAVAAVRAARDALLSLPAEIPMPQLPPALASDSSESVAAEPSPADTAVDLDEKEDDASEDTPPEPLVRRVPAPGPQALVESAARLLGRSEAEIRARVAPALSVYLRALTSGTFVSARGSDDGSWVFRGATRAEQPFSALPDRERALVCLALQLALLEALSGERRVPILLGPDLPVQSDSEARALGRALKRLSAVVQVVHACAGDGPFAEHAGKSLAL